MLLHRLLFLFIAVPLLELAVLLWIGQYAGWQATLCLVAATGLLGAWLARREGGRAWDEVQRQLQHGRLPASSLMDGAFIVVAAALLITPGVLTDAAGFFLLIPPGRRFVRRRVAAWAQSRMEVHVAGDERFSTCDAHGHEIIDAEFTKPAEVDASEKTSGRSNEWRCAERMP